MSPTVKMAMQTPLRGTWSGGCLQQVTMPSLSHESPASSNPSAPQMLEVTKCCPPKGVLIEIDSLASGADAVIYHYIPRIR